MKITIKVALEGDDSEGRLHSTTVLGGTGSERVAELLDTVVRYLLIEGTSDALKSSDLRVSPERWVRDRGPRASEADIKEADRKFLKDAGIGGWE